jgi:hypothetical protein
MYLKKEKTMQKLSAQLIKMENHKRPLERSAEALATSDSISLPLIKDRDSRELLGASLAMFWDTMRQYGKKTSQLENLTKMFIFTLAEYPYEKISKAFRFYAKHYSEMPTPADIVSIIERNGKPPFERAVYVGLKQKPKEDLLDDEWQYIRDYEQWAISGG